MQTIVLSGGAYELRIAPEIGGAVTALRWRGRDLLRPAPGATSDVLDTAMFPLAPYANRIAKGCFEFAGRRIELDLNFGDHPHALHGHAWQRPWRIDLQEPAQAVLSFAYRPGDWPWAYSCRQRFSLAENGFIAELEITNHSEEPMPVSFGFHPYFPRPPGTVLQAHVEAMWEIDATVLPTHLSAPVLPLSQGAVLDAAPFIDHCFTGWGRRASVRMDDIEMTMSGSAEFGFLHLYVPRGQGYFCVEPVSAMPDAVNRSGVETGLRVLSPEHAVAGSMRIEARRLLRPG